MKKILFILAACFCLALTGCQFEKDIDLDTFGGKGLEFVHFESASTAWMVTANDESYDYSVPVGCSYAYDTDKTYEITLGEGTTGEEGKDFQMPRKSVTIKAGDFIGELPIKILYDTTGPGFEIELILNVEDKLVNEAYGKVAKISVKSDKISIDWEWLEGSWDALDFSYNSNAWDASGYTAAIVKVDETHCKVKNLWGSGCEIDATVDFDTRLITVTGYQYAAHTNTYSADLYILAVNPETDYDIYEDLETPFYGEMSPAGIVFDNYDFLLVGGPYNGYTYAGGIKTQLTR